MSEVFGKDPCLSHTIWKRTPLLLTREWTDRVDYWAVDFDYPSRREIIKVAVKLIDIFGNDTMMTLVAVNVG